MPAFLAAALSCLAVTAPADAKTIYLSQAGAEGMVEFLDRLVEGDSEWTHGLKPHWEELKGKIEVDAGDNSLTVTASPVAVRALETVLKALDVPRTQVTLRVTAARLVAPEALFGVEVDPPVPGSGTTDAPLETRVAVGDWGERLAELIESEPELIEVISQPMVATINGTTGTVFLAATTPEVGEDGEHIAHQTDAFCLQARPVVMDDASVWLSLSFGRLVRDEPVTPPDGGVTGDDVCVSCGPGLGDWQLVPEITVTARVPVGESMLVRGLKWYTGDDDSVRADDNTVIAVIPELMQPDG